MILIVNGKKQEAPQSTLTIAELLVLNKVEQPDMVSVQLNRAFVDKKHYPTVQLKELDEVDFLYFMGVPQSIPMRIPDRRGRSGQTRKQGLRSCLGSNSLSSTK